MFSPILPTRNGLISIVFHVLGPTGQPKAAGSGEAGGAGRLEAFG